MNEVPAPLLQLKADALVHADDARLRIPETQSTLHPKAGHCNHPFVKDGVQGGAVAAHCSLPNQRAYIEEHYILTSKLQQMLGKGYLASNLAEQNSKCESLSPM